MTRKLLFLLVEGDDEERFFRAAVMHKFEQRFTSVQVWKYSQQKPEKVKSFINSINAMPADYILFSDINLHPCVTAKKQAVQQRYMNVDPGKIIIVIREIESWYIAGLDNTDSRKLGMSPITFTDGLTKEQCDNLRPKRFRSMIDFKLEILKCFSIETAVERNRSFQYFTQKCFS